MSILKQVYETMPYCHTAKMYSYLYAGFKICRKCDQLIRCQLRNCPECGGMLSTQPRTSKAKRNYRQWLKNPKTIEQITPCCSKCRTKDSGHIHTKANGSVYFEWYKSRVNSGAKLCKSCMSEEKKALKKPREIKLRVCSQCGSNKSAGYALTHDQDWYKDDEGGYVCKVCYNKQYRKTHVEARQLWQRRYYQKNRVRINEKRRKKPTASIAILVN